MCLRKDVLLGGLLQSFIVSCVCMCASARMWVRASARMCAYVQACVACGLTVSTAPLWPYTSSCCCPPFSKNTAGSHSYTHTYTYTESIHTLLSWPPLFHRRSLALSFSSFSVWCLRLQQTLLSLSLPRSISLQINVGKRMTHEVFIWMLIQVLGMLN